MMMMMMMKMIRNGYLLLGALVQSSFCHITVEQGAVLKDKLTNIASDLISKVWLTCDIDLQWFFASHRWHSRRGGPHCAKPREDKTIGRCSHHLQGLGWTRPISKFGILWPSCFNLFHGMVANCIHGMIMAAGSASWWCLGAKWLRNHLCAGASLPA